MIQLLQGDDWGVPRIPEAVVVEWKEDGRRVVFSYAKQGNGITVHLASDRANLRYLEPALNDFCEWLFSNYAWCTMLFGIIERDSIKRLAQRCGFQPLCPQGEYEIYVRTRL